MLSQERGALSELQRLRHPPACPLTHTHTHTQGTWGALVGGATCAHGCECVGVCVCVSRWACWRMRIECYVTCLSSSCGRRWC